MFSVLKGVGSSEKPSFGCEARKAHGSEGTAELPLEMCTQTIINVFR